MSNFELPPQLVRVENTSPKNGQRRAAAKVLRTSPALRTLTDIVRGNEDFYRESIAPYIDRREDFKDEYDVPGRAVAPLLAGIARHNPDLLDASLGEHFDAVSNTVYDQLESDAFERGYSYWPLLVVGSGPQAQILTSQLLQEREDTPQSVLIVEKSEHVGGTFNSGDSMNFRLNSRTRKQTDEKPVPGTAGNLNILKPGIIALADVTTATYSGADELGRTIRMNHALNGIPIGLGLEVTGFIPDSEMADPSLPGDVSVAVRAKDGNEYTIRANAVAATVGVGAPKLNRFDEPSRALIKDQREARHRGERSAIMTYADFYEYMNSNKFPLKGIKSVCVIGAGDSGRTTVGTLLGYEPRTDDSVLQLDTITKIDWYGQKSLDDETFIRNNRQRYGEVALDMPRRQNNRRINKIMPYDSPATGLDIDEETGRVRVRGFADEYDLVVVATGFESSGTDWLAERVKKPLLVSDNVVQEALDLESDSLLESGDVILFPEGYNISQIQVLSRIANGAGDKPTYVCTFTDIEGNMTTSELLAKDYDESRLNLGDYCAIENFIPAKPESEGALGLGELRITSSADFTYLSAEVQNALLENSPVLIPKAPGTRYALADYTGAWKVEATDESSTDYYITEFVGNKASFRGRPYDKEELKQQIQSLGTVIVEGLAAYEKYEFEKATYSYDEFLEQFDDLAQTGVKFVLMIDSDPAQRINAYMYKDDGKFIAVIENESRSETSIVSEDTLKELFRFNFNQAEVYIPTPEKVGERAITEVLTLSEYGELSGEKKEEILNRGVIFYFGSIQRPIIVKRGSQRTDGRFNYCNVTSGSNGGYLTEKSGDGGTAKAGDFYNSTIDNSVVLIDSPLLEQNRDKFETLELSPSQIAQNFEEFVRAGATFLSTDGTSELRSLYIDPATAREALVSAVYSSNTGFYGLDQRYNLDHYKERILNPVNNINRVLVPRGDLLSRAELKYPDLQTPKTIVDVYDETTNDTIAKRLEGTQLYLVGPAAGLKPSTEAVGLIPDIPENSVGIFISQPRTVALAGSLANRNRFASRSEFYGTNFGNPNVSVNNIDMSTEKIKATISSSVAEVPAAIRQLPAETALQLGMGITAREMGYVANLNPGVVKVEVTLSEDGELNLRSTKARTQSFINSTTAAIMFGSNITEYALRRLLSGKAVQSITVTLPFDARGLQVGNLGVEVNKQFSTRSGVAYIPDRPL